MYLHLLARIAAQLEARGVPYMVIGGQAVLVHGEPRFTKDIDITLGVDAERYRDLVAVSESLGCRGLVSDVESFVRQTMVLPVRDDESGVRVNFVFSNSSYELQALERAQPILIEQVPVRFASVEDLVILKTVSGRPRDMEDVRAVMNKHPEADRQYIRRWLKTFEAGLEQPLLQRFDSATRAEAKAKSASRSGTRSRKKRR